MGLTLEELRTRLGRNTALIIESAATVNNPAGAQYVYDTNYLGRFSSNDALYGGILYVLETTDGNAPEGEWRYIVDYTASSQCVEVDYGFSQAVSTDDLYEIYRVPLSLDMWDRAINAAILDAWPEVWHPGRQWFENTGVSRFELHEHVDELQAVFARAEEAQNPIAFKEPLVRDLDWRYYRNPNDNTPYLDLLHPLPINETYGQTSFYLYTKERYRALGAGETTYLDESYIMASAMGHLYRALAMQTGGQSDRDEYLRLMNYWRGEAQVIKQRLAASLGSIMNPRLAEGVKSG